MRVRMDAEHGDDDQHRDATGAGVEESRAKHQVSKATPMAASNDGSTAVRTVTAPPATRPEQSARP